MQKSGRLYRSLHFCTSRLKKSFFYFDCNIAKLKYITGMKSRQFLSHIITSSQTNSFLQMAHGIIVMLKQYLLNSTTICLIFSNFVSSFQYFVASCTVLNVNDLYITLLVRHYCILLALYVLTLHNDNEVKSN